MSSPQLYDGELQMFVQAPRLPNQRHLEFLRWLAERGRLEHHPLGAPVGPFAASEHSRSGVSG
ncbi:MAG: hypothetical protein AB7K36_27395, partial [Chloroflexota bacterium]